MAGLFDIPEPTSAYRVDTDPPSPQAPLPTATTQLNAAQPDDQSGEEPQQQIDSASCLLLLLVAGGLLRAVLGLLGPLQGLDEKDFNQLIAQGNQVIAGQPTNAYPLMGLLGSGLSAIGLPAWVAVAVGSLLTLAAVPAAYVIGRAATGRRAAGILAAAMVAVHPAVLTGSNMLAGGALAMALVTIGLALACHAAKRGLPFAIGGGLTLALAALAAPLCWIPAALAGPFVGHLSQRRGQLRAFCYATTVFAIALGPVVAYRAVYFGATPTTMLVEFANAAQSSNPPPVDRLAITLTDPSLAEMGEALHLPLGDAGQLASNAVGTEPSTRQTPDRVADLLADAWLMMNAGLAGLAAVSLGVMLVRRRVIEAVVLGAPLLGFAFATLPAGEVLRVPMLALVGVLAAGLLANRPVSEVDEAAREAKRLAKQAAREEKQRARQEYERDKRKQELFAFDRSSQKGPHKPHDTEDEPQAASPTTGVLTARVTEDTSIPMRPI